MLFHSQNAFKRPAEQVWREAQDREGRSGQSQARQKALCCMRGEMLLRNEH